MIIRNLLEALKAVTISESTLTTARLRAKAFTRKRSMQFSDALSFMLDMRKTTVQTRLNMFFRHTKGGEPISQQAFSKLRANFDHSPFEKMVRVLVEEEYSGRYELPCWNGFHVFSVDGSYLQLPKTAELAAEYGVRGGGNRPSAGISVLYDVLHGWAIDPIITGTNMNERTECARHIDFLCAKLPHIAKNSVILLDRGYPSKDLFGKLQSSGIKFLARCKSGFSSDIDAAPIGDSEITLKNGVSIRIIKFLLSNGETETLASNIFTISSMEISQLYTLRWGIETAYFRLKHELCIESFSGKTPNAIRQDFWASMVLLNSVAVFQKEADKAVSKRQSGKNVKHTSRARTSDLIVTLRDRFIFANLCGHPIIANIEIKAVIKTLARVVSPVRPGRSFNRVFAPCLASDFNLKSHL